MKPLSSHASKLFWLGVSALLIILLLSRFFGNQYDNYRHLHPDERWLVMVVDRLSIPENLDPDFFAYGSLPMYTLKVLAQSSDSVLGTAFDNYDGLLRMGRALASLIDIGTALLVFTIAFQLTKRKSVAVLALASYVLMFFPTQNSNFFIVDNFVNFFFSLTMLCLVIYWRTPNWKILVAMAISFGLLLSSKITPIILTPVLFGSIAVRHWLSPTTKTTLWSTIKQSLSRSASIVTGTKHNSKQHLFIQQLVRSLLLLLLFSVLTVLTTMIAMPYAWLKSEQFIRELSAQISMNSNAYVFPYTLQYVNTTPYLFHLRQMFWWGVGPVLSLLALSGLILIGWQTVLIGKTKQGWKTLLLHPALPYALANILFFLVIGQSAVKFMRYMLPLYPALAMLAGFTLASIWGITKLSTSVRTVLISSLLVPVAAWYFSFMQIYAQPHSRIAASEWMLTNIPTGSALAVEHWDDRLPLYGGEQFTYIELPIYEQPDDQRKWSAINSQLAQADYIVLASNRLHGFLPRLATCVEGKPRCYPQTAEYYRALFAEELGFTQLAEFTNRPNFLGYEIIDDNADESFTVYDHPRVIIFKRN